MLEPEACLKNKCLGHLFYRTTLTTPSQITVYLYFLNVALFWSPTKESSLFRIDSAWGSLRVCLPSNRLIIDRPWHQMVNTLYAFACIGKKKRAGQVGIIGVLIFIFSIYCLWDLRNCAFLFAQRFVYFVFDETIHRLYLKNSMLQKHKAGLSWGWFRSLKLVINPRILSSAWGILRWCPLGSCNS